MIQHKFGLIVLKWTVHPCLVTWLLLKFQYSGFFIFYFQTRSNVCNVLYSQSCFAPPVISGVYMYHWQNNWLFCNLSDRYCFTIETTSNILDLFYKHNIKGLCNVYKGAFCGGMETKLDNLIIRVARYYGYTVKLGTVSSEYKPVWVQTNTGIS